MANEPETQVKAEVVLLRLIEHVEIPARTTGLLSAIHVVEGQQVKQGTLLAQIDDADARLMYQRAKVELSIASKNASDDVAVRSARRALAFARKDYLRRKKMNDELPRSVAQSELDEAELRADQAKLDLERATLDLTLAAETQELKEHELQLGVRKMEICRLVAPLNGVVVEMTRRPGEWVEAGDKVLRIVRLDRLRAEGLVAAQAAPESLKGSPVTVSASIAGHSQREFPGKVVFVSPEINPVSGLVRLWAELDNPNGLLRPGLRVTMTIRPLPMRQHVESAVEKGSSRE